MLRYSFAVGVSGHMAEGAAQRAFGHFGLVSRICLLLLGPAPLPASAASALAPRLQGVHRGVRLRIEVEHRLGDKLFHTGKVLHAVNGTIAKLISAIVSQKNKTNFII